MSVLIKGMKMPKSCLICVCDIPKGNCDLWRNQTPEEHRRERHPDCPLVEVPTPYGPLIDSNRLIDIGLHLMHTAKNDDIANGVMWLWQYIIEAPTIIESEDE